MIIGIGVDIIHTKRLERWLGNEGLLRRYFHPQELETVRLRGPGALQSLAARFAAKEAVVKALGRKLGGFSLKDIASINDKDGRPVLHLYGDVETLFRRLGGVSAHLSLSHDGPLSVAMVVLEGE